MNGRFIPDTQLSEKEFIDKYQDGCLSVDYLKARYTWLQTPTKENWHRCIEEFQKTKYEQIIY